MPRTTREAAPRMTLVGPNSVAPAGGPFRDLSFWGAVLLGTIVSLIVTGYAFPENNNAFHLPIVGKIYDDPALAGDKFIQTLRYFPSGLWLAFAGSAHWVEPGTLFLVLLVISRTISVAGFLLCADQLGITLPRARYLFALLIAATSLMQDASFAGDGGLFLRSFTQSEITTGLFLLALWALLSGRFTLALCMIGPAAFLNAFIGVWLAFVVGVAVVAEVVSGRVRLKELVAPIGIGAVVGAVCATPVVLNILANPSLFAPSDFAYEDFLRYYYPAHFLFDSLPPRQVLGLVLVGLSALLALWQLPHPRQRIATMLGAVVLLYVVGIVAPYISGSQYVLNLHLLRSSTFLHVMAALLTCTVFVKWFFAEDNRKNVLAACAIVAQSLYPFGFTRYLSIASIVGILALETVFGRKLEALVPRFVLGHAKHVTSLALVALIACAGLTSYLANRTISREGQWRSEWQQLGTWARSDTASGSVFLVPVFIFTKDYPGQDVGGGMENASFEYLSRRSLWVDFKRGAQVMWSPSRYHEWRKRAEEVERLTSHAERMQYAVANRIPYIVEYASPACDAAVFRTQRLCVFSVNDAISKAPQ